jgi:UDP-glucose 4-epimerase
MRILLTGPFGTIGTRVLNELLSREHSVTCFDLDTKLNRKIARKYGKRITMQWGDITDTASVTHAVENQEAVIHLAAIIPPLSELKPAIAEKVNVGGTKNIVDAITAQAQPPLLLFPSSISVHGFSNNRKAPCRIDMPFDARDHYAGHKIACEQMLHASSIPWVIVRIGACVDAINIKSGDNDAMMRQMFSLDPKTRVEYLHPQDAAIAIANAVENRTRVAGKTLFLGSGKDSQTLWLDFINIMPCAMGLQELPASAFGTEHYYTDWMDTAESQQLLQFQQYGLDAYRQEVTKQWQWLRILLWPIRGLIRKHLLKFSPNTVR